MARGEGEGGGWKADKGRKGRRETQSKAPGAPFVNIISQPLRQRTHWPTYTAFHTYTCCLFLATVEASRTRGSALLICVDGLTG